MQSCLFNGLDMAIQSLVRATFALLAVFVLLFQNGCNGQEEKAPFCCYLLVTFKEAYPSEVQKGIHLTWRGQRLSPPILFRITNPKLIDGNFGAHD